MAASVVTQAVNNNCLQIIEKDAPPIGIIKNDTTQGNVGKIDASGKYNLKKFKILIYPNPAHDFLNVSIDETALLSPLILKIIDLSGRILSTNIIKQDIYNVYIPINLRAGNYIITLESGSLIRRSQKLIII